MVTSQKIDFTTFSVSWSTPTLLNSWVNYGGGLAPARYKKDKFGVVWVQGMIKSGTTTGGTVIFNLPAGYRPAYNIGINIYTDTSEQSFMQLQSNGNLICVQNVSANITGFNFSFIAEA